MFCFGDILCNAQVSGSALRNYFCWCSEVWIAGNQTHVDTLPYKANTVSTVLSPQPLTI